jgi:hypothetical protein
VAKLSVVGAAGNNPLLDLASSTGTSLVRVTPAGNVGIGTTTPQALLSVNPNGLPGITVISEGGNNAINLTRQLGNGGGSIYVTQDSFSALTMAANSSNLTLISGSGKAIQFSEAVSGLRAIIVGGNFGIGTATPTAKLNVTSFGTVNPFSISSSSGVTLISADYLGNFNLATLTPSSLVMSDAGKNLASVTLGAGLTISGNTLNTTQAGGAWTVGSGLIYNATSTDLVGIGTITPTTTLFVQGKSGTNPFAIASSTGTQLVTVTQDGRVGINSSTPSYTFVVQGAPGSASPFAVTSSSGTMVSVAPPAA